MYENWRQWGLAASVALPLGFAACTLILDRDATQCRSDADCASFGNHPFCRDGACVESGLGPSGCIYPTPGSPPLSPQDYLNQCTVAACLPFSDCDHGICSSTDFDAGLRKPLTQDAGASTPPAVVADAGSLPLCEDATEGRERAVFITGSSNVPPLFRKLAPLFKDSGLTLVYQITNSCTGVKSMVSVNDDDHVMRDPAQGTSQPATFFPSDGTTEKKCLLGENGARIDIGESDIFSPTCEYDQPDGQRVRESFGPIQAMAFVVPGASSQTAISAEVAYEVFGNGGKIGNGGEMAMPWNDPTYFFVRNKGTGTQQMIARAIRVPADQFWGTDRGTADKLATQMRLITDSSAEKAIGIISVDAYDANRNALKALAFQAFGQKGCAYLPDSSASTTDKRNVRDGHYPIWGPMHFFAEVSGGELVSDAASAFLSVISVPDQGLAGMELLNAFIGASLVPTCAMGVQRTKELGDTTPYSPLGQCHCYFEARNGETLPECKACSRNEECPVSRPFCWYGYCEEK